MDELWRLLHLLAAGTWLGGLVLLAVVAVVARRRLDEADFRRLMAGAGRGFAITSAVAWTVIAVSGAGMAWPRLHGQLANLGATAWGNLLEAKTGLAALAVALTVAHSYAGARTGSRPWVLASRVLSPVILLLTIAIFWLAVRMTEG